MSWLELESEIKTLDWKNKKKIDLLEKIRKKNEKYEFFGCGYGF